MLPQQQQTQIKTPLWKTRMCKFMQAGNCGRGEKCQYAHHAHELRPTPDFSMSSICPALQVQGGVCKDPSCRYAHDYGELREVPDLLKTKPCKFWARAKRCSLGEQCRFAHGEGVYVSKARWRYIIYEKLSASASSPSANESSPKASQLDSTWSTQSPLETTTTSSGQSTADVSDDGDKTPDSVQADIKEEDKTSDMYCQEVVTDSSDINVYNAFNQMNELYFTQSSKLNNAFAATYDEQRKHISGTMTPDAWGELPEMQENYSPYVHNAQFNLAQLKKTIREQAPNGYSVPLPSKTFAPYNDIPEIPLSRGVSCPTNDMKQTCTSGVALLQCPSYQIVGCEIDLKNTFIEVRDKPQARRRSSSCHSAL